MAVPTQKVLPNNHPGPVGLDHYRCYRASGKAIMDKVGLSDQLILPLIGHVVFQPVGFCNHVQQFVPRRGDFNPILNSEVHLTCYSMNRTPFTGTVTTDNQFARQVMVLGTPDTLCFPTRKIAFTVVADVTFTPLPVLPGVDPPGRLIGRSRASQR